MPLEPINAGLARYRQHTQNKVMSNPTSDRTIWDLSHLYADDDDPQLAIDAQSVAAAHQAFDDKWRPRRPELTNPHTLIEAIAEYEALHAAGYSTGNAGYYFELRATLDQTNTDIKAKSQLTSDAAPTRPSVWLTASVNLVPNRPAHSGTPTTVTTEQW